MKVCAAPGCSRTLHCRGYCSKHYRRLFLYGDPINGKYSRPDSSYVNARGYRQVKRLGHPVAFASGWALEHRVVAWDTFGPFPLDHHVHHINHDKLDNRPENLVVLTADRHSAEHRRVDRDEAVRLYQCGLSTIMVGEALRINPATVSRILAAAGVPARRTPPNKVQVDPVELTRLHALPGATAPRVAEALGVSIAAVRRAMREAGLPSFRVGRPVLTFEAHDNPERSYALGLLVRRHSAEGRALAEVTG